MDSKSSIRETSSNESKQSLAPNVGDDHQGSSLSSSPDLCLYQGFWYSPVIAEKIKSAQEHFEARPGDIVLCSYPKTGTTWLKSLAFAIATRSQYSDSESPLLTTFPHHCIPYIEHSFGDNAFKECLGGQRLIATHIPYTSLPASLVGALTNHTCKIIYIFRDPKDTMVSFWHFMTCIRGAFIPLGDMVELFCEGKLISGSYWDHVVGYWKASSEHPQNILLLKFEALKSDTANYVKRLAEFMGCPFSPEEEEAGEVDKIIKTCSFESLSNLEVNKVGTFISFTPGRVHCNNILFRRGEAGDWKHHLTPEMKERLDLVAEEKLKGYGITF